MKALPQAKRRNQRIQCLVIQTSSFGDSLQGLMALRAAHQLYPSLEIHMIVREGFTDSILRVPWIKSVITLPTQKLLRPILNKEKNIPNSLPDFAKWLSPVIQKKWDFVVNWSFSSASSYLSALIPAEIKLGYSRRNDLTLTSSDGWSHYIQAIVQQRVHQNIHLTDILTTQLLTALQIHVGDPIDPGDTPVTSKDFFDLDFPESQSFKDFRRSPKKWVGIQLGSSGWSASQYAELCAYILRRHSDYNVVLLGSSSERGLAAQFKDELRQRVPEMNRVISTVGRTDFNLWASLVGRCQWLFSSSHAPAHLAGVLGTRVVFLDFNGQKYTEIGPYGNQHYIVTSSAQTIRPEAVYAAWSYASSEWSHRGSKSLKTHFEQLGWEKLVESVNVFRSRIRATEDGGGVVYEPMFKKPLSKQEWTSKVMGQVARYWYCGWVAPIGQELERQRIHPQLLQELREVKDGVQVIEKICREAERAARELQEVASRLKSQKIMPLEDRERTSQLGDRLKELDALIARLSQAQTPLSGFDNILKVMMHNLSGKELSELGKESSKVYRKLLEGIKVYQEWLDHTLVLAKPHAVQPERKVMELNT